MLMMLWKEKPGDLLDISFYPISNSVNSSAVLVGFVAQSVELVILT